MMRDSVVLPPIYAFDSEWDEEFYLGVLIDPDGYAQYWWNREECIKAVRGKHIMHLALHNPGADFESWGNYYPDATIWNTLAFSWLVDENTRHGLGECAKRYLGQKLVKPIQIKEGKAYFGQVRLKDAAREEVLRYCIKDAVTTQKLAKVLYRGMSKEHRRWYWEVEEPLDRVLYGMRQRGARMDLPLLKAETEFFAAETEKAAARVYDLVGYRFKLSHSSHDTAYVLFSDAWVQTEKVQVGFHPSGRRKWETRAYERRGLGMRAKAYTPTGRVAVDSQTLESYDHPVISALLHWRGMDKLLNTYLRAFPRFMRGDRLHGRFNSFGAVTGRFSSSEPNLQNIPRTGEHGKRIRNLFIAEEGKKLVVADQEQIELRLAAGFSKASSLIQAFAAGEDIHQRNAELAGHPGNRDLGKTVGYAVLYGVGAQKLGKSTGLGSKGAAQMMANFYEAAPELAEWIDGSIERAYETFSVNMLGGRKRLLPDLGSLSHETRTHAERQVISSIIQGSAASLTKQWMVECRDLPLILTVHDELVAEVPVEQAEEVAGRMKQGLKVAADKLLPADFGVEIVCVPKVVDRWGEK